MGAQKKVYSFRFEESMVKDLLHYADMENRKLSNLIETILLKYLSEKKSEENNRYS